MAEKKKTSTSKPSTKRATKSTKSSARKSATKKTSSTAKRPLFKTLFSIFWKLSLATFIAIALYFIYLDAKITRQFEGNKWQLPAQVYARSMTFFPGQFLSEQEVLWELKRLNYTPVNRLSRTGQYIKTANSIKIFRRDFEFYDGLESAHVIELRFSGEKVASIKDKFGRRLNTARL
ncbi:MAG: penicillin-binding protein 1B, partial [Pseudoalteromonas tetraodonis]